MAICIPKEIVDNIKQIKDLSNMSSEQRRKAFSNAVGSESAGQDINLLYEKTLTLKNQTKAFDRFVDDISGVSVEKKTKIKQAISDRLAQKQETINDKELLDIVKETVDRKYELDINEADLRDVFNKKKRAAELEKFIEGTPDGSPQRLEYGRAVVDLSDKIAELKNPTVDFMGGVKKSLLASKQRITDADGILGKVGTGTKEFFDQILSLPYKGIKASWDASYLLRQGLKLLTADPKIYKTQAGKSLSVWKALFNSKQMDEMVRAFKADIVSRQMYKEAIDNGLAIGVVEDFFPTNTAEKIPGIGNAFKASDQSFTMFSQGARMDLYEKYIKALGDKATPEVKKSLARYVNSLTGRGNLDKFEAVSGTLNQIFFSARYQIANLKTFTDPLFAKTAATRNIAAKNLATHAATIFTAMQIANQFSDVGFDPKSKRFGKMRVPGTSKWVDITGGLGSYLSVLGQTVDKLQTEPKYGQDTAFDVLTDFAKGKLAPAPGALRDFLEQRDYSGQTPTPISVLRSLFVPINADNFAKNLERNEDLNIAALQVILETIGLGISSPK